MLVRKSTYTRIVVENAELKEKVQNLAQEVKHHETTASKRLGTISRLEAETRELRKTIATLKPKRNNKGQFSK